MIRILSILCLVLALAFTFACSDDDDDTSGDDPTAAASDGAEGTDDVGATDEATAAATEDGTDSAENNAVCASLEVLEESRNAFSTIDAETTVGEIDTLAENLATSRAAVGDAVEEAQRAEHEALEESLDALDAEIQTVQDEGAGDGRAAAVADAAADAREDLQTLRTSAGCS